MDFHTNFIVKKGKENIKIFRKPKQVNEDKHFKGGEYVDYEEIK